MLGFSLVIEKEIISGKNEKMIFREIRKKRTELFMSCP